uniref:Uncharacterized protein n=1 Tax=Anguilla anguilla TaxID=7936 RepID=A0A0E9WVM9_ANGAN
MTREMPCFNPVSGYCRVFMLYGVLCMDLQKNICSLLQVCALVSCLFLIKVVCAPRTMLMADFFLFILFFILFFLLVVLVHHRNTFNNVHTFIYV